MKKLLLVLIALSVCFTVSAKKRKSKYQKNIEASIKQYQQAIKKEQEEQKFLPQTLQETRRRINETCEDIYNSTVYDLEQAAAVTKYVAKTAWQAGKSVWNLKHKVNNPFDEVEKAFSTTHDAATELAEALANSAEKASRTSKLRTGWTPEGAIELAATPVPVKSGSVLSHVPQHVFELEDE